MSHSCPQTPPSQASTKPFAMLRHDFAADPRLSDADVRVMVALMYWARDKPDCWPCVESIGKRVNKKERAVQIALKNLEHFGYIRLESDGSKKTGRRIVLSWQADGERGEAKEGDSPRKRIRDKAAKDRSTEPAPHICAPKEYQVSPCEAPLDHQQARGGPSDLEITLPPILDTVCDEGAEDISEDRQRARVMIAIPVLPEVQGRSQAMMVNTTAKLIAGLFLDEHSLDFHRLVCWRVAKGKLDPKIVSDAFAATYDKIVTRDIGVPGSYYHGCLKNLIGGAALDEFAAEFKEDRERAKREYACRDVNLLGDVA